MSAQNMRRLPCRCASPATWSSTPMKVLNGSLPCSMPILPWSLGKIGMEQGKDPFKTFIGVLDHVAGEAQRHGKRLMFWADIDQGASTLSHHPELLRELPGGAIAVPWVYDARTNYDSFVQPLAGAGVPTVVAPAIWNWNEIFPDYHRSFININRLTAAG